MGEDQNEPMDSSADDVTGAAGYDPSDEDRAAAEAAAAAAAVAEEGTGQRQSRAKRARQQAQNAVVPFLVALVVSVAFQQLINFVISPDAYIFRLFRPAGGWVMSVVPALIFFVLVWTLTDLALKWRAGMQNDRDLRRADVTQMPMLIAQEGTNFVLRRLSGWDRAVLTRQVGRRLHWLLHHLDTTDPKRAHELLRHQSDLDADTGASSYAAVKLFIWAMPILGFIGTVLGISLAVGGFSDFLTTNVSIDEIDTVTAELGNVASGLSFAFDTTLLGLLAGLIASVASSAVQHREERLLTRLDEFALRVLASATAAEAGQEEETVVLSAPAPAIDPRFEEALEARLNALHDEIEEFTVAVRSSLDGLRDASSRMNSGINNSIGSVSESVQQVASGLDGSFNSVSESVQRIADGLDNSIGSVNHTVQGVADSLNEGIDGINGRMSSMERSNEQLSEAFNELAQRLAELRETQAALAPVLNQLAGPLEIKLVPTQRDGGAAD